MELLRDTGTNLTWIDLGIGTRETNIQILGAFTNIAKSDY